MSKSFAISFADHLIFLQRCELLLSQLSVGKASYRFMISKLQFNLLFEKHSCPINVLRILQLCLNYRLLTGIQGTLYYRYGQMGC